MIFLVSAEFNNQTWSEFLNSRGQALKGRVQVILPHELATQRRLQVGTYIFTDPDLWTPWQREVLGQVWQTLAEHAGSRLLNNPIAHLGRLEFQRSLVAEGINNFRTFTASALPSNLRFPVFLRFADDHKGARSPLLEDWEQLEEGLLRAALGGADHEKLLITEFSETVGEDGLYRKYGVYRIGKHIIPRLINFDRSWVVKSPNVVTQQTLKEEMDFLQFFSDHRTISHMFDLGGLEFGRVDYSFENGQMRVWEINPNPVILLPPNKYKAGQQPALDMFFETFLTVLAELNVESKEFVELNLSSGVAFSNQ